MTDIKERLRLVAQSARSDNQLAKDALAEIERLEHQLTQLHNVKRYELDSYMEENCDGEGSPVGFLGECSSGDWVRYSDVVAIAQQGGKE